MKKILATLLFPVLFFLLSITVHAENYYPEIKEIKNSVAYDVSGNIIKDTWCYESEDGIPSKFYLVDKKGKIIEESDTKPVEAEDRVDRIDEETGWIEFKSEGLENVKDTLVISLINEKGENFTVYLFKDNNYAANKSFPVGTYQVLTCGLENDLKGTYLMEYPSEIKVTKSKTAFPFHIKLNQINKYEPEETDKVIEDKVEVEEEKNFNFNTIILLAILIGTGVVYFIYKNRNS